MSEQIKVVDGIKTNSGAAAHHVVAVRKDEYGRLTNFKLEDGTELDFEQCRAAIHHGQIPDLICTEGKSGAIIIRSYPDGDVSNNLDNLPEF